MGKRRRFGGEFVEEVSGYIKNHGPLYDAPDQQDEEEVSEAEFISAVEEGGHEEDDNDDFILF